MKAYRIMDESVKDVNALLKGETSVINVKIQGFKGLVELRKENVVKSININEKDYEIEKSMFIVVGTQDFKDVESFEITNTTKPLLKESIKDNKFIECKYNNSKALYNAKSKICRVVFEGLLYVA